MNYKVYLIDDNRLLYTDGKESFEYKNNEWLKISTVYDYNEKYDHTPWELLSNFKEQEKIIVA